MNKNSTYKQFESHLHNYINSIIDARIRKHLSKLDLLRFYHVKNYLEEDTPSYTVPILKFTTPEKLDVVYSALTSKENPKLLCIKEEFKNIFFLTEPPKVKYRWLGLDNEFAELFGKFIHRKIIITKRNFWEIFCLFFCRFDNTNFNPRALSSAFVQSNNDFSQLVDDLIGKIKS